MKNTIKKKHLPVYRLTGRKDNMFHCFINYKVKDARVSEVFKTEQFHFMAENEYNLRNIKSIICDLLNRLNVEYSIKIMFMPNFIEKEGEENDNL